MGTGFKCGCRRSGSAYYFCPTHEARIEERIEIEHEGTDKEEWFLNLESKS